MEKWFEELIVHELKSISRKGIIFPWNWNIFERLYKKLVQIQEEKILKSPGQKHSWNQINQFHGKKTFFKNGKKSIFKLGKSLKLNIFVK